MIKKIAITAILLGLLCAVNLIAAEDPPGEKYTVEVYVTVHTNGPADVDVGCKTSGGTEHNVHHWRDVGNGEVIHYTVELWPPNDPPPTIVFARGWGLYGGYDYDEAPGSLYYPVYLELWIGLIPEGPPQEAEQ
jgi:hypothetical protein